MIRKIALGAAAFIVCSTAHCLEGITFEYGRGDDRTNLVRLAWEDPWRKKQLSPDWRFAGYWEISGAVWDNRDESTADLGLAPVARLERDSFYLEGAVGLHLVQTRISAARVFSTALQFAEHAGVGMRSGKFEYGVRVQHLSNGGVRRPNPGINFLLVRLRYVLE